MAANVDRIAAVDDGLDGVGTSVPP